MAHFPSSGYFHRDHWPHATFNVSKVPFTAERFQSPHQNLPEIHHMLGDAECWLDHLPALKLARPLFIGSPSTKFHVVKS